MIRGPVLLLLCFLVVPVGFAKTEAINQISDIVLIRGSTSDLVMAAQAGRFARNLVW
jgi:hypothetical protein